MTIAVTKDRNSRSFSVVPPCEAFASLSSHTVLDYRQKNPLECFVPISQEGRFAEPAINEGTYTVRL
jgi:hypothetical protein